MAVVEGEAELLQRRRPGVRPPAAGAARERRSLARRAVAGARRSRWASPRSRSASLGSQALQSGGPEKITAQVQSGGRATLEVQDGQGRLVASHLPRSAERPRLPGVARQGRQDARADQRPVHHQQRRLRDRRRARRSTASSA